MKLNFEWDEEKARANLKKHRVSFDEDHREHFHRMPVQDHPGRLTIERPRLRYIASALLNKVTTSVQRRLYRTQFAHTYRQLPKRQPHRSGNFMKKPMARVKELESTDMRIEYDFRKGVRGKHSKAMQAGYTITIHKADGTTMVKDVMPKEGAVVLEPEIQAYFPDSDSVNRTLRCLIPLLPQKRRARTKKS